MTTLESNLVRCGDVEIDLARETVRRAGTPLHLRQKSLRVLLYLAERRERVVPRRELLDEVWHDATVTDDTLVQSIVEIRKALGAQLIRTLPRSGYRFEASVADPGESEIPEAAIITVQPALTATLRSRAILTVAILALVGLGLGLGAFVRREGMNAPPPVAPKPRAAAQQPLLDAMTGNLEAYNLYTLGVARARSFRNEEAIALFEKALALDPGFAMAHARIGYTFGVSSNDPERAKPHFDRALQLAGRLSEKDRLYIEAWQAITDGRYDSAIELLRAIMARYPTELEAFHSAGKLLAAEERLPEAASVLERGLLVDASFAGLHNSLGTVYMDQGRRDEALAAHERYVALAPLEPNAHDSLGMTCQSIGAYDKAIDEYQAALRLDPHFGIARVHLANTWFQMGRHREAIREFERFIADAPSDRDRSRGYSELSAIYRVRGDFVRAEERAQKAMVLPRSGIPALLRLALDRGDHAEARRLEALLADTNQRTGRGSRVTLRITHDLHGQLALKSGRSKEAIEFFQRALRYRVPGWSIDPLEDCLANAYFELRRYREAAQEYERVLTLNPNYGPSRFRLAHTYEALGRPADASREYKRFLETWKNADPDVREVIEARQRMRALLLGAPWRLDVIRSSECRQDEGLPGELGNPERDRRFVAELESEVGEQVQDRGTGRGFSPLGKGKVGLVACGARLENAGQQNEAVASDLESWMS